MSALTLRRRRPLSPPQVLAFTFGVLIAAGTVLLRLPMAAESAPLSLVDAFFTATSAVCVTGLIVVDTPGALSTFGELLVLLLIQLGGLGYMTLASLIGITLGKRVTLQERLILQEGLRAESLGGITRFAVTVFSVTVVFELAGWIVLTLHWLDEFGWSRAAYLGLFHAVSAFNNAGFSLFSTSLTAYQADVTVNLVVGILVICGGAGFLVLAELRSAGRRPALSLHTKLVLSLSALLLAGATLIIYILERSNPATLGPMGSGAAWLSAFFQAMTPRTAGFNTIDIGALEVPTKFVLMALMFIGAAPGGTGGGVKISTFAITVVALWATVRGSSEPTLFKRRLPPELVARAFFICLIGFLALNVTAGILLIIEQQPFLTTLFETTSAFGTVGLSTGSAEGPVSFVGQFSSAGKLLIVVMMFTGRLGPLTLAVALAGGPPRPRVRYPEGKVLIG